MSRRIFLAVLLLTAAACGPATTEPVQARSADALHDGAPPPPPDSSGIQNDTTRRGGGTIGSGT